MRYPIYVFTGFLDSGKTSCVIDTFEGEGFYENEKCVLLRLEDGEVAYSDEFLKKYQIHLVSVNNQSQLNAELLAKEVAAYQPDIMMIEYNGMWKVSDLYALTLPDQWEIGQVITCVDATTFGSYMSNMRNIIYEQLRYSDLIICNRCDENTKQVMIRNNIKAINKKAQIIYEGKDGQINQALKDTLPFDIEADPLIISDDNYGLWYMDMLDNPRHYIYKEIIVKGMVLKIGHAGTNSFLLGRYALVCCADDLAMVGILVESTLAGGLVENEWIEVVAQVEVVYDSAYGGDIGILIAKEIKACSPLDDPNVYFN